ncbi:MAG: hypothetical protein KDD82_27670 [Planctomycetes bacterium]|nr:hypothetical protein [Planctomycetota bacterium]
MNTTPPVDLEPRLGRETAPNPGAPEGLTPFERLALQYAASYLGRDELEHLLQRAGQASAPDRSAVEEPTGWGRALRRWFETLRS